MWIDAPWKPRRWQEKALPVAIQALKAGNRPVISAIMGAGKSVLIAELVYHPGIRHCDSLFVWVLSCSKTRYLKCLIIRLLF